MARVVFRNANLLDGEHAPVPSSTVVVEDERIVEVGDGFGFEERPGDRVVDCTGLTLMPGMTIGHFHPTYSAVDRTPIPGYEDAPAYLALKGAYNIEQTLRAGFTTGVGASSPYAIDPSLAKAVRDGIVAGTRVIACSAELVTTGDSTDHVPWHWGSENTPGVCVVDGPTEYTRAVRREIKRGAEIIKFYVTGGHGVRFGGEYSSVTSEELTAAVNAAHALGVRTRAHVASKAGIMKCLAAGIDVIDHGDGIDEECIERMAEAGVSYVPSIYLFGHGSRLAGDTELQGPYGQVVRATAAMLPKAAAAGIPIALGDDYGASSCAHGQQGGEPAFYEEMTGLGALEIIKWATVNGGAVAGRADLGRIQPGYVADIVVLDSDPSADLQVLADREHILAVMRDGALFFDRLAEAAADRRPRGAAVG